MSTKPAKPKPTKINNIFIDGSYNYITNQICIGIYNQNTQHKISKVYNVKDVCNDKTGPATQAERIALQEGIKYCQQYDILSISRFFTDCRELWCKENPNVKELGFVEFIWIPRELNKIADSLASSYVNQTQNITSDVSIQNDTITTTTTTTQTSKIQELTKEQIIDILLQFPYNKRLLLIKKMSQLSIKNKKYYNHWVNGMTTSNGPTKWNTYYYLIPLILEMDISEGDKIHHLEKIITENVHSLLKSVKLLKNTKD